MNQNVIDEIVANVLAQLQPLSARPVNLAKSKPIEAAQSTPVPPTTVSVVPVVELMTSIITADVLENAVRPGQSIRIGRNSILTPSARDWLHSRKTAWSRHDRSGFSAANSQAKRLRWQVVLQTVTPAVRALQEALRRLAEGWKFELVGQPQEAAMLATNLVSTAEYDGVVIFTEQAELIACKANRNERVRAAVMQNSKQWEQVMRTLSANVICINPIGRTFIEMRNLLRECVGS